MQWYKCDGQTGSESKPSRLVDVSPLSTSATKHADYEAAYRGKEHCMASSTANETLPECFGHLAYLLSWHMDNWLSVGDNCSHQNPAPPHVMGAPVHKDQSTLHAISEPKWPRLYDHLPSILQQGSAKNDPRHCRAVQKANIETQ